MGTVSAGGGSPYHYQAKLLLAWVVPTPGFGALMDLRRDWHYLVPVGYMVTTPGDVLSLCAAKGHASVLSQPRPLQGRVLF